MLERPQITYLDAQQTAIVPITVLRSEIASAMGPGLSELLAVLASQDIEPSGPWFNRHLRMDDPEWFEFEISVPVPQPVAAAGRVQPSQLPATRVARTTYHGPYEGLAAAWGEFNAWIASQDLNTLEQLWECYSVGPESSDDPADWCTDLYRPLRE